MNAPCKDCQDRKHLCHSTCERYAEYAKDREKERNERARKQKVSDFIYKSVNHVQIDLSRRLKK